MFIYKTTNLIDNKIYIGKHTKNSKKYIGSGKYLKRAIKKYGRNNFKREIIEDNIDDFLYLNQREIYWINFYDSRNPIIGYNLTDGGEGVLGWIPDDEWRKNKSESLKGEKNHWFGTHLTESARKNMSDNHAYVSGSCNPMFGRKHEDSSSDFLGVQHEPQDKFPWFARFHYEGNPYPIGHFSTEIEAALAYNETVLDFFGWNAKLNIVSKEEVDLIWNLDINIEERHYSHQKLKEKDVIEVKKMIREGNKSTSEIAKIYNVSWSTISNIKKGKTWKYVEPYEE